MAVCVASRRLTLLNVIQGLYRTELVSQHAGQSAINTLTVVSSNCWSSKRTFSTSQAYLNGVNEFISDVTTRNTADEDIISELTSTKPGSSSESKKNSKSTSEKSKDRKNKPKEAKKIGIKKSTLPPLNPEKKRRREQWQVQKEALQNKFQEGWHPRKKLPPDSLDTIRHLYATKPDVWTTPVLAEQFKVSPEAIRRILKSKWQPSEEERQRREERWAERYRKIYSHMEELGLRKPKGEWTAKVSDARRLGLEEKPLRQTVRKQPRSDEKQVNISRPDREPAPKGSTSVE
ncbi:mitochondrion organization and biogenesis protein, putative [Talaromyces stipitatus ATCC 10500]|uniref:Required for respiratory growth protein 9, mitochondrial n=1 Tax=Talaromyces stipitatus (strain ATCC 10500 / CBS 375.48 / QM 6759 / NRRL 1006) TaxID=441959 RepID=RRG9_TALSN|nr:mitochondrion organization and biogenesis protein, putative [Talaromyces stipitatus ATCC 10500]B8MLF7.1 RecName: Full=Required for respiratory growth protein 9, mitochondrial; Flags: Precursor [Talaromyces stipitatus ATCC 10500]EED15490.1 mitochondrion organization and biogenesis protein, putative [Talaromyces stipitatus ATCC 10500]